jgi:hypothetical protein
MAIRIGNQGTITASTRIAIDSAKSFFNFIFSQQWAASQATVTNIGGFTSMPTFTPTSNAFTFNSKGIPTGTISFSFTMISTVATDIFTDLIQNEVTIQTLSGGIGGQLGNTFVFTTIIVAPNDIIQIRTYTDN